MITSYLSCSWACEALGIKIGSKEAICDVGSEIILQALISQLVLNCAVPMVDCGEAQVQRATSLPHWSGWLPLYPHVKAQVWRATSPLSLVAAPEPAQDPLQRPLMWRHSARAPAVATGHWRRHGADRSGERIFSLHPAQCHGSVECGSSGSATVYNKLP